MLQIELFFVFTASVQSLKLQDTGVQNTMESFKFVFNEHMRFVPTQGEGGRLSATEEDFKNQVCKSNKYTPSPLEDEFRENINAWTQNKETPELCIRMGTKANSWISQNRGETPASGKIFSKLCKEGHYPQLIEPLAGILRDPRFPCQGIGYELEFSIDWLLMADESALSESQLHGKKFFFDAGGTHFSDATKFFASYYEKRGILFDHIYVWEANKQKEEAYWKGVEADVRAKWEPRVTFYNGVPVSAEPGHEHNVVERIYKICGKDNFCAFKLDIDTPSVELPLIQQLLAQPKQTSVALDELFFEHHVHGTMQYYGWKNKVNGTFADSIDIFTKLRQMGVRSHSWI